MQYLIITNKLSKILYIIFVNPKTDIYLNSYLLAQQHNGVQYEILNHPLSDRKQRLNRIKRNNHSISNFIVYRPEYFDLSKHCRR